MSASATGEQKKPETTEPETTKPEKTKPEKTKPEKTAILAAVTFLVVGFVVMMLAKLVMKTISDAVFITLLLLPALVYLILSDRISGLKAPGGLELTFVRAAEKQVKYTGQSITPYSSEMAMLVKGPIEHFEQSIRLINFSLPVILALRLGEGGYDADILRQYVNTLSRYRNFELIVVVDPDDRFVACFTARGILWILNNGARGAQLVQAINDGRPEEIKKFGGAVVATLVDRETNLQALQKMKDADVDALLVTRVDGHLEGVVQREKVTADILGDLLLTLAK
jgi:uncharacterized membrane protein YqjE